MDVLEVCSALSNETRLNLISIIIENGAMTSKQAHDIYEEEYSELRRQTIHAALNQLSDADILEKYYNQDEGGIVYNIQNTKILIELEKMDVIKKNNS